MPGLAACKQLASRDEEAVGASGRDRRYLLETHDQLRLQLIFLLTVTEPSEAAAAAREDSARSGQDECVFCTTAHLMYWLKERNWHRDGGAESSAMSQLTTASVTECIELAVRGHQRRM